MTTKNAKSTSIGRLRALILVALIAGISIFTGVMFTLVQHLSERFGPQVEADLEWRAARGAQELAKTADLGLAVSDAAMVKESFGVYAKSSDVQAIVAVDATGQLVAQHGTFADAATVFAAKPGTLATGPGYIASWAPAVIEGNAVGKIAVVVSTARMTEAETSLHEVKRTTLIAGVVGLVLGCVVVLFFTRSISIRDKQLNDYAHNLERKVEERTAELDARNRGMRLVLDNVAQGFITVDPHGVMASERSAIVGTWFGEPEPGTSFGAMVGRFATEFSARFDMGLDGLRDEVLPFELLMDQMPQRFVAQGKTFDVSYSPLRTGEHLDSMLVIVSDVSTEIERQRTERDQREIVEMFQRITTDRAGFDEFFSEGCELVDALRTPSDTVLEKRVIHTLKGNCAVYGIHSFADLCHAVETELTESDAGLSAAHRARLLEGWAQVTERLAKLRGERKEAVVEISPAELSRVIDKARAGVSSRDLATTLAGWMQEPVSVRFERLGRQATGLGRRLGKPNIDVTIRDRQVRLDSARWIGFWSAMIHAVRNAVDHGIESAAERQAAGKSPTAALSLAAVRQHGRLVITLSDDGRGIDWEALRAKAVRNGLPATTEDDLKTALFTDGVSTREEATELSGRGVGLGALREAVELLGGSVDVRSQPGAGTSFLFSFPDDELALMRPPTLPPTLRKQA